MAPALKEKLPVTVAAVVMRPILLLTGPVNHKFPSGPETIDGGYSKVGNKDAYSVTTPVDGTTLPTPLVNSVNHMFPSGPVTIPVYPTCPLFKAYGVSTPAVVTFATCDNSVSQRFPSGPDVMPRGKSPRV